MPPSAPSESTQDMAPAEGLAAATPEATALAQVAAQLAGCRLIVPALDEHLDASTAGQLAAGFGNLGEAIRQAAAMALGIAELLPRIAADSDALSAHSREQAEAVTEVLAGTQALRGALNAATEALHGVRRTAEEADQRAAEGQTQSEQLAEAMREAQTRAKRINRVIEVIDLVAFQTHILSINAAVEAAHAGERGKGFAVVAAEVRTLADRAAQAAKEARAMVSEAEQALATGGQRARETGERLRALGALVARAGAEMGDVASRVDAQDAALAAMEVTLADVASISRGNVERAEHVAQLAADARGQTDMLSDCVRLFELPGDPLSHPRHARVQALAAAAAAEVGKALAGALGDGRLTREALFSTTYVPIADTDPTKFSTPFDALCDALLPAIQEPVAAAEPWIVFAISANRDGYVPTHNLRFCRPLTGDRARDLVGNRTKRLFGDRVGRTVGRHEDPWKLQVYRRDTGEIVFDLSVPILVDGQHWGGFRIGYALG